MDQYCYTEYHPFICVCWAKIQCIAYHNLSLQLLLIVESFSIFLVIINKGTINIWACAEKKYIYSHLLELNSWRFPIIPRKYSDFFPPLLLGCVFWAILNSAQGLLLPECARISLGRSRYGAHHQTTVGCLLGKHFNLYTISPEPKFQPFNDTWYLSRTFLCHFSHCIFKFFI